MYSLISVYTRAKLSLDRSAESITLSKGNPIDNIYFLNASVCILLSWEANVWKAISKQMNVLVMSEQHAHYPIESSTKLDLVSVSILAQQWAEHNFV